MGLGGHADNPLQHVVGHPVGTHRLPGVNQNRDPFLGTVVEKPLQFGIVQVSSRHVGAHMYADVASGHRPGGLGAGPVNILEWHLAKRT